MGGILGVSRGRAARLATALSVLWFGWLAAPSAEAAGAVLVGAGDIAKCGSSGDSATAGLLASIGGTVFTLGDNVYEDGTAKEFRACFGPTWGRFRGRIRPAMGNHEYGSAWGRGYWDYFGSRAGPRWKGWYSYSAGSWRVIVLNSNCSRVDCHKGSEQERWLRAELARHTNKCTLAYFHHPRFSSDEKHGNSWPVAPFWEALYEHGADLVLSGHAHSYERFAPQTPWGKHDPSHGIRQIVVGTGGATLYDMRSARPNSQVRNANTLGVLKLNLSSDSYRWNFIPQPGKWFRDSGHGKCHGRP